MIQTYNITPHFPETLMGYHPGIIFLPNVISARLQRADLVVVPPSAESAEWATTSVKYPAGSCT